MNNKAPSSKLQAPEKLQTPSFKMGLSQFEGLFGAWSLMFLWTLELGPWSFSKC
jgi:hypothetical protein